VPKALRDISVVIVINASEELALKNNRTLEDGLDEFF
jgi:hypothetical protein